MKSQIFSVKRLPEHLFSDFESHKQIFSDLRSPEHPLGVFKTKTQNLGDLPFSDYMGIVVGHLNFHQVIHLKVT